MNFFVLGKFYSMYDRERMSCIYVIKEVVEKYMVEKFEKRS